MWSTRGEKATEWMKELITSCSCTSINILQKVFVVDVWGRLGLAVLGW